MRTLLAFIVALGIFLPGRAEAFPWMIHHGYTNCAQCHVDPSGAGALTAYGRAQGDILLRTHYKEQTEAPGKKADFLFGAVKLPKELTLQADVRGLMVPEPGNLSFILMQADLRGAVQTGPFVAYGSIGPVSEGSYGSQITSNPDGWNLTSREYWVGVQPAKGWMVRAGRMDLPFGIRTEDHILYVRSATRTDTKDDQSVGAAVQFTNKKIRAELMGIAGNYQVHPDDFRERGYSGYLSYSVTKTLELGVSSLVTHAAADVETYNPRTRQAHGIYLRAAPVEPLAIMAEGDVLLSHEAPATGSPVNAAGLAASAVVDYEPVQGLHVQGIGEYCNPDFSSSNGGVYTVGGAAQWFFAPRVDLRVDVMDGVLYCTPGATATPMGLLQAHFFL